MGVLMFKAFLAALFFLWLLQVSTAQRTAIAYIQPTSNANSGFSGSITFTETDQGDVAVTVEISGLETDASALGIHVHTYGDQTDVSGAGFGGHWVGAGSSSHGCPPSTTRHEGDLGSWEVNGGEISQTKVLDLLTLSGSTSIMGRGVIVHDTADPCDSTSTGARIGYGVIGYTQASSNNAAQGESISKLVCSLQGTSNCPDCEGEVYFQQVGSSVRVTAQVRGLSAGSVHGIHVHQYGDVTDRSSGASLGGHWNLMATNITCLLLLIVTVVIWAIFKTMMAVSLGTEWIVMCLVPWLLLLVVVWLYIKLMITEMVLVVIKREAVVPVMLSAPSVLRMMP